VNALGLHHYLAALKAAARDVNAHGGVKGRPVEIDNCDDASDPMQAQSCARKLVQDRVIATAGNLTSFGMLESPILDEAGIAQVGTTALSPEESMLPTSFPIEGGLGEQLAGAIYSMKRRGLHSIFVVAYDQPTGKVADMQIRNVAARAGVDFAGDVYMPSAAGTFGPYVQAAIQSKADVLVPALPGGPLLRLLAASNQAGAKYHVAYPGGELEPREIATLGGAKGVTDGSLQFFGLPPPSAADRFPAVRTFQVNMDAEFASGDKGAAPDQRTTGTLMVWLAVEIISRIASTLPTVDAQSVLHALTTSPTVDTLGLTPPWTPGKNGPPPFTRVTNRFGYFITQRGGQEVLDDPTPFNPYQALGLG
jgi:ABC-type branched-subunit amino acid transport system substrate-binding protein